MEWRSKVSAAGAVATLLGVLMAPVALGAQDSNVLMSPDSIEVLLSEAEFEIVDRRGSRGMEDRTDRVAMNFADGTLIVAKWGAAPPGGHAFNNAPRYELAAYEIQKLFLDPLEYVVPPTALRAFDREWYRAHIEPEAEETFDGTRSVLSVLQYWLLAVTPDDFWDEERFAADSVYARHFGNFNILTYVIRHSDENVGNYLVSTVASNPRVFAVDNGVAFSSPRSDRGYRWRRLHIDRLPAATVERLRALTPADLEARLATLVEYRVLDDGRLERTEPTPSLDEGIGVRRSGDRIQFGLTSREIGHIWGRIRHIVDEVDDGDIEVF